MLLFFTCSLHVMAQTSYYYYKGMRIPLILNESKVCVSIPKDSEKTSKSILAGIEALNTISDDAFDIFIITRSDFEKLTSRESWEDDARYVVLTSSYFTEVKDEVFETPYLSVRLNKEQDIDLLNQYAEKYGLKIWRTNALLPLWYIVSVTLDSEKSPLECANELYESGNFAAAEPDFAANNLDLTADIRKIVNMPAKESSDVYNLSGRKKTARPAKGIYILRGKKILQK